MPGRGIPRSDGDGRTRAPPHPEGAPRPRLVDERRVPPRTVHAGRLPDIRDPVEVLRARGRRRRRPPSRSIREPDVGASREAVRVLPSGIPVPVHHEEAGLPPTGGGVRMTAWKRAGREPRQLIHEWLASLQKVAAGRGDQGVMRGNRNWVAVRREKPPRGVAENLAGRPPREG